MICLGDFPAQSDSSIAAFRSYSLLLFEQVVNRLSCDGTLFNPVAAGAEYGRLACCLVERQSLEKVWLYLDGPAVGARTVLTSCLGLEASNGTTEVDLQSSSIGWYALILSIHFEKQ